MFRVSEIIEIRYATLADAGSVFAWRNDPDTIRSSISQAPLEWEKHLQWWTAALANDAIDLYIMHHGDDALAHIRIDHGAQAREVSIVVAPEERGQGYGQLALDTITNLVGEYVARIKHENEASVKIFQRAGFVRVAQDAGEQVGVYKKVRK